MFSLWSLCPCGKIEILTGFLLFHSGFSPFFKFRRALLKFRDPELRFLFDNILNAKRERLHGFETILKLFGRERFALQFRSQQGPVQLKFLAGAI